MVNPCRCGHEKGDHQGRIGQRGNYTPCCICPTGTCDGFSPAAPSAREQAVLDLLPATDWARPMDVGGRDGNGISHVLAVLVRKGLVERQLRGSLAGIRASYVYRRKVVANG